MILFIVFARVADGYALNEDRGRESDDDSRDSARENEERQVVAYDVRAEHNRRGDDLADVVHNAAANAHRNLL